MRPLCWTDALPEWTVLRYIDTLIDALNMCIRNPHATVQHCIRAATRDLDDLWQWNHLLPPTHDFCMHDVIDEKARHDPTKVAIVSWDGSLTYDEVANYSTYLASWLVARGVRLHDFVPLCFEKSRWTIVAVLAVMKAGGTLVMMDPSLPLARLRNMAQQVNATTILSSRQQQDFSTSIMPDGNLVIVEADIFTPAFCSESTIKLAVVLSSALMYLIFTSGSTGTPKGVKISHQTYTSSALPRALAVGYTQDSRVLDFASYAFDVSIDSMLLTLGNGGCLCIPSDEDRLNDINSAIRKMQINYAGLTPSVARILEPDVIASLEGLGLGGEAASPSDVTLWGQSTRIIIGYGPCECTIGCTINSSAATGRPYISIGTGNGAAIWIVDPNDHDVLLPVGAVGELLVEGPIVGQGYLNDPEKTSSAFIEDPTWLTVGHKDYAGRHGRLYKTGDLGKYDPDGSGGIVFVGRKDTQVKLRGQRIELSEIESQLNARLPSDATVIAEVIKPTSHGSQPTLVAFVTFKPVKERATATVEAVRLSEQHRAYLSEANCDIATVLPRYMVPAAYIPVDHIPVLISGKTDRKRLREYGATVDLQQLDHRSSSSASRELNDIEKRLRQVWSKILNVDEESVGLTDNFFALGGDSLAAMKLVSASRTHGLQLSVVDTFNSPTLAEMAGIVRICKTLAIPQVEAFSLISQPSESARFEAAQVCRVDPTAIEDIYPCTPTQESLFTFSIKSTDAYIAQRVSRIPSNVNIQAWKRAWDHVVAATPILRTRLAQLQDSGLQQVVLKESISWKSSTDLAAYLKEDRNEHLDLGQSLTRYTIVHDMKDNQRYMVWTAHHVVYDGWSEPVILQNVSKCLQAQDIDTPAYMKAFVRYIQDTDAAKMKGFWRQELNGAIGPQFPRLPTRDYMPNPSGMVERRIRLDTSACSPFTKATVVRGAWALVASQYTRSDDVVFGETFTGRDIALPGAESIVGPLIATIPMRVRIHRSMSTKSYLHAVQQSVLARIPYQHMGMQNIRKVSQDAQYACEAGTGLVIQPEVGYDGNELGFDKGDPVREALHFNPYPLMLAFGIRDDGFRVRASFDVDLVSIEQMERVLAQLEATCQEITMDLSRALSEVSCLPAAELDQIWQWNQGAPLSLEETTGLIRAATDIMKGSAYPQTVVPWVCDPANSAFLSPIGCTGELWLEGSILPGKTTQALPWLLAGSSTCAGRCTHMQATGDLVQLQADGGLLFMGRKVDQISVQDHIIDVAELETHASRHVPSATRVAAAVVQSPSTPKMGGALLFVEQESGGDNMLSLLSAEQGSLPDSADGVSRGCALTLSASISANLAIALKRFDKFVRDSLPSYMLPTGYVVVKALPVDSKGQIDHVHLDQLASNIPTSVFIKLREGLERIWSIGITDTEWSASETILRSAWANVLKIPAEHIDVEDNFFRLGGDSVLAMKLISSLRAQGHRLTVADIFQNMRLGDAAKVLKIDQSSQVPAQAYKPFSTLGNANVGQFLSEVVHQKLANTRWTVQDMAPVTDLQALDIKATVHAPRTSVQYNLMYFDHDIDQQRLMNACTHLVKTHDILRSVFVEHESVFYQVILEDLNPSTLTQKVEVPLELAVADVCASDAEQDFPLGSSFLKFSVIGSDDGRICLVLRLSHAQYDGTSLPHLLRDLEALYTGRAITDFVPFPAYVSHIGSKPVLAKAKAYWLELLRGSSMAVLDGISRNTTDRGLFLSKPVNVANRPDEITTASLLTAAWALLLARRLQTPDVTFGSVASGRNVPLANVEQAVGPCYNIAPIRVRFQPQWTAVDLLLNVQKQVAESAAYDFLGFKVIAQECGWDAAFFDSIVHHQDFEEFDTMPFADGECRVDVVSPHGDAPHPFKAVTFSKRGELHVGVVGSQRDSTIVEKILADLAGAVEELMGRREGRVLVVE